MKTIYRVNYKCKEDDRYSAEYYNSEKSASEFLATCVDGTITIEQIADDTIVEDGDTWSDVMWKNRSLCEWR